MKVEFLLTGDVWPSSQLLLLAFDDGDVVRCECDRLRAATFFYSDNAQSAYAWEKQNQHSVALTPLFI